MFEEQKPHVKLDEGGNPGHIILKVKGEDGNIVNFKVKRKMPLKRLMDRYCERQSLWYSNGQMDFLFNGQRLMHYQTPDELNMENGDVIEALFLGL